MIDLNQQKYRTDPERSWLLATGDEELIEGNWYHDTHFGICYGFNFKTTGIITEICPKCGGGGENKLGKFIMMTRSIQKLREWWKVENAKNGLTICGLPLQENNNDHTKP